MDNAKSELALEVKTLPGTDGDDLARLIGRLRRELLDLDVDTVRPRTVGLSPEGAKSGVEMIALGGLVVQFLMRQEVLTSIVDGVRSWLQRQSAQSVKLTLDGDSLEVTGLSSAEQDRLVEHWVARHASPR
jgi:hypothetical protein